MRIIVVGLLYIIFMLFGCPQWLAGTDVPYIVRAVSYSFFHASIIHLAINCLSVWVVWQGKDLKRDISNFFTALIIAVLVYPIGFKPCVGISNMLFASCGLRFRSKWFKTANGIIFLALMLGMCFLPQFAGLSHLCAYAVGMLLSMINNLLEPLKRDVRHLTGNR